MGGQRGGDRDSMFAVYSFFFFQAEDGIRDHASNAPGADRAPRRGELVVAPAGFARLAPNFKVSRPEHIRASQGTMPSTGCARDNRVSMASARRPSGAEEGEAALCRGRRGGGLPPPPVRNILTGALAPAPRRS